MIRISPVRLDSQHVILEPLTLEHIPALIKAASDGELWNLHFTSVPEPQSCQQYVEKALQGQQDGHMLPWAVRTRSGNEIVGSTRYHDIICEADRVEIGYTWYARRYQRTYVNTATKLLLMSHAFETLGCGVVGLRTDILNLASQRAIERLGAKKDGVIRQHALRRDGTIRDTVMYSILRSEWPEVKAALEKKLEELH